MIDEYYKLKCKELNLIPKVLELTDDERIAQDMIPILLPFKESLIAHYLAMMGKNGKGALIKRDYAIECLNFVNGKRSVLDIRNLVCTEYKFMPVKAFIEHFKKLFKERIVKVVSAAGLSP